MRFSRHLFLSLASCLQQVAIVLAAPDAVGASYDYVIIGGGTAGLVLANRLTENPSVTVAVIEPGGDTRNNINVTSPFGFPNALGTSIDWAYQLLPKSYNGVNRTQTISAGKALGGTTTINGMTYVRAQKAQIDGWETIGNKGWNWANMWPYFLKHEVFQPPTKAQAAAGAAYNPAFHGTSGKVAIGWEYGLLNGSLADINNKTWQALGYRYNPDVNGGNELGFTVWPREVNRTNNTRCDAANAYLWPYTRRPNLHIVPGFVNKINWSPKTSGSSANVTASGVQYVPNGSKTPTNLNANKEVLLCAGALKSPSILELSGVGNPAILSRYGIKTVVNSTGVGEHLQEQPNTALFYQSPNATANSTAPYVTYSRMSELFGSNTSAVAASANSSIASWAQAASTRSNGAVSAAAFERLFRQQWALLFQQNIPAAELLNSKFPDNFLTAFWTLITFSRGSVHIGSADPTAKPVVDLDYFAVPFDLDVQVAIAKQTRKFYATQPIQSLVKKENKPGLAKVPLGASDKQWADWLVGDFNPNHHPVSTAAMLPRELGGVVDERLRVYGTGNVRVVDASVFPAQVSGHLSATVYAIAERAADMIKGVI